MSLRWKVKNCPSLPIHHNICTLVVGCWSSNGSDQEPTTPTTLPVEQPRGSTEKCMPHAPFPTRIVTISNDSDVATYDGFGFVPFLCRAVGLQIACQESRSVPRRVYTCATSIESSKHRVFINDAVKSRNVHNLSNKECETQ